MKVFFRKKMVYVPTIFCVSIFAQHLLKIAINLDLLAALLTYFSILFGFYMTSFAVFATSKYISKLYRIEDSSDNRKTLLDVLIEEFSHAVYFLLVSILYVILASIIVSNNWKTPSVYILYLLWGLILLNTLYSFVTVTTFIKVTRQSAKQG